MTDKIPGILAPAYVLGEEEKSIDALVTRDALLDSYRMPDNKKLWGCDRYRKSRRTGAELASATARITLERGGLRAEDIDALILCCGEGLNYHAQDRFTGQLSQVLGLRSAFVTWIGGSGCTSLFSAVQVARVMVLGGVCRNALVIAVNKIASDEERFQRYGVFSDGACSFVICNEAPFDYSILAVEASSTLQSLGRPEQDLGDKYQLIYDTFAKLTRRAPFAAADSVLLGSNVFLPIQDLELSVMPLNGIATYRNNTVRYGHCAGADPIINLIDYFREGPDAEIRYAVLAATAHGHFAAMLLQPLRCGPRAEARAQSGPSATCPRSTRS